jgi:hypothetical protein
MAEPDGEKQEVRPLRRSLICNADFARRIMFYPEGVTFDSAGGRSGGLMSATTISHQPSAISIVSPCLAEHAGFTQRHLVAGIQFECLLEFHFRHVALAVADEGDT